MVSRPHRLAAIDIGTVTTRMLVADVSGVRVCPLLERTHITHLGEGVSRTGHLSGEALGRVSHVIDGYVDDLRDVSTDVSLGPRPVERVVAMATSAARDADNAAELEDMLEQADIELLVIDGQREARLSFLGAASGFPRERMLLADIGGGSTELVFGDASLDEGSQQLDVGVCAARSFDLGCRRLTEQFLTSDPPAAAEMERLRRQVRGQVGSFVEELPCRPRLLVVVGGTATTLVAVDQHMERYDASRVNGAVTSREMLEAVTERLASRTEDERRRVAGLQPQRAGVIVAGALILEEVVSACGLDSFVTSESDILEGVLLDAAARLDQRANRFTRN